MLTILLYSFLGCMLVILVYNFLDCLLQFSLIYRGVKLMHHAMHLGFLPCEAPNINVILTDSYSAINFKDWDCNLLGPLAFKGSIFFISRFKPSISILVSRVSTERDDVNLSILKSSSVTDYSRYELFQHY